MVDKFLLIPFVLVLGVVFLILGLFAYYGPNGGQTGTYSTIQTVHIQSAVLDDLTTHASAPCSVTGLDVICAPTFHIGASDSMNLNLVVTESANSGTLSWTSHNWALKHGANTIKLSATGPRLSSLHFSAS